MMLTTPVLLLAFNRPTQTLQVLAEIRRQQPAQMFVAADGARPHVPGEAALCEETRAAILRAIDWPCELQTLFQAENLGCGKGVSTAITWFFTHVDAGIILEDDCIPDPSFFSFCTEMLHYYRDDDTIMHINGSNFQGGQQRGNGSYYFSRYSHVWGWASWRRAWQQYDFSLEKYRGAATDELPPGLVHDLEAVRAHKTDTWDVQWFMCVWFNRKWTITPNACLVRNIGYGRDATHTFYPPRWYRNIVYGTMKEIIHPEKKEIAADADAYAARTLFSPNPVYSRIKFFLKKNTLLYKLLKRIAMS